MSARSLPAPGILLLSHLGLSSAQTEAKWNRHLAILPAGPTIRSQRRVQQLEAAAAELMRLIGEGEGP